MARTMPSSYHVLRMELVLILGPMKSGKTFDLIGYFSFLQHTTKPFVLIQPTRNVRDENIHTRHGIVMEAVKVRRLSDADVNGSVIVGIDEMHMFHEEDADSIERWLQEGRKVVISSLDTDHQGRLFPVVKRLLEMGPKEVRYRRAACDICKNPEAIYTQVLRNDQPLTDDFPPSVPDDGTFQYKSVCRKCFIRSKQSPETMERITPSVCVIPDHQY